jgi:hypothetical protein
MSNPFDPAEMPLEERNREVAALFAAAYLRLCHKTASFRLQPPSDTGEISSNIEQKGLALSSLSGNVNTSVTTKTHFRRNRRGQEEGRKQEGAVVEA